MQDFNYFNDIENPLLRTWNRLVTVFNLREDAGAAVAQEYINNLSKEDNHQMIYMAMLVKKVGKDKVKEFVLNNTEFPADA